MSNQLNYTIKFGATADRASFENVKKSIADVVKQLGDIDRELQGRSQDKRRTEASRQSAGKELADLRAMTAEAEKFQTAFKGSFNDKLGAINLTQLNNKLKETKVDLNQVYKAFQKTGLEGTQGFRNLTAEILSTNRNLEKTTTFLDNMMTTMGNTIKWGLSSSIMNSFTGAVQSSYNYVKDLDKSLNNIRIVSGKSADQMERFAKQANAAAQNLGSTTLDYTNAALIYEQQGLGDADVAARTETTLKMSNVLGVGADEVSNYMTAIWNNFYDGSKTLEYYADVLTKLGAATASSAEEISTGLEKFAAIADTVGLSYEYATAALTTVTATTRQSAEVVGTAFKTLFARIQDLELGETLDDGTTLGKYSEALDKVGISIMDSSGEMRKMDDILHDMGEKWDTLTKAQQVSLAQTVAGTRQYTQLVALMDNWDEFGKNLETAANATGSLDEQQAIFADSVEAHMNEMEAAWEGAYEAFFDEDTIKGFADAMKGLGNVVSTLINGLGGGGSTLLALSSVFTTLGSKHIAQGLAGFVTNAKNAKQNATILNAELEIMEQFKGLDIDDNVIKELVQMKQEVLSFGDLVTDSQQNATDATINMIVQLRNQYDELTKNAEAAKNYAAQVKAAYDHSEDGTELDEQDALSRQIGQVKKADERSVNFTKAANETDKIFSNDVTASVADRFQMLEFAAKEITDEIESTWLELINSAGEGSDELRHELIELSKLMANARDEVSKLPKGDAVGNLFSEQSLKEAQASLKKIPNLFKNAVASIKKENPQKHLDALIAVEGESVDAIKMKIDDLKSSHAALIDTLKTTDMLDGLTKVAGSIGQIGSGILAIKNIGNIFTDDSLTSTEKVLQILVALSSSIPMVVSGFTSLKENWSALSEGASKIWASLTKVVTARAIEIEMKKKEAKAEGQLAAAQGASGATATAAAAGEGALAAGNAAVGTTAAAATPSIGAMSAAIWSIAWPVLAVVAALALLAVGIYAIVKAYNAESDAAKEAAEAAEHAKTAAEEAATAYEKLNEGITNYKEGVDALKELTAGTEEYKEALDKANQAVMDLVKADASLAKYVKKRGELYVFENEKGEDITDEILSKAEAKMHSSEATANMAQIYANDTSLQNQRRQLLRSSGLSRKDEVASAIGYGMTGNIPAAIYQAGNAAFNSLTDEQLQTVLQTITDNYGTLTRENLEKLSFLNESEIDALMDNKTSLEQLAKSTDDLNATNKLLIGESMANALENNSIIQNAKIKNDAGEEVGLTDKHKNAINALYSEGYTKEQEAAARKKLKDEWYKDKAFGGGNEDAVHAEYARIMGYELAEDKVGDKAVFVDKNGKEITVSDDAQRAHIVNTKLAEQIDDYDSNNLQKITDAVSSVNTTEFDKQYGINLDDAFLDAVASGGDFDFSSMFADISPSELEAMSNLSAEDWQSALGLTDEELKTLGFDSSEDLLKSIEEGFKGYEWDPDAALSKVINRTDNAADLEDKGLDPTEVKEYAKHLMTASDESDKLADSLGEDADAAYVVAKGVMRMNNGVEKLSENFDDWSDVLKKSDKSSEEYHEALSGMQDAVSDLLDTEDEYVTDSFIQEHMEDIEKAANGDAEAIDRLHKELAKDMVFNIATDADMTQAEIDALVARVENLEIPDIEAGVKLDGTDEYAQELMKIVQDSKMTAEQAKAFFGQMGFDAQFETHKETINQTVPVTKTDTEVESIFPLKMTSRTYQDGYQTISQEVDVPSLSTEDGKPPKVTLTKKADGSMNNASKINKGGKGSGGSGSKAKNEAKVKDEKDIYHDINIELKQISNSLGKIQKEQEGLVGKDLIENLAEQYALLNKQLDATAEKIRIAEGEAGGLREKLEAKGVKFNEDGTIANYADAYDKQLAKLNATIEKYNKMSPEQQEKYQKTLDKAKEEWEQFLENISRYDEILTDEIPGMMSEIQDTLNEQIEIKLQAFEYEVKIRLDLAEAKKEWNEFKADILEGKDLDNDPLAAARVNRQNMDALYNSEGTGSLQATTAHIGKIMEQLAQMDADQVAGIYGETYTYKNSKGEDVTIDYNNRAKALEDLKTYIDENIGGLTEFNELMGDIYGNYVDLLGKIQEGFDKQAEAFDTLDSMIQHDMELIKMAYGEEAYDKLSELYDKDLENSKAKLAAASAQVEYWKKEVAEQRAYVATLEEGTDEWWRASEALTAAEESLNGAIDAESQAVLDAMQKVTDKLLFNIDKVFSELNKSLTDGLGLEYASLEWELIGAQADDYLDTVNAIYSTQQLQNKYLDAIEKSSNPAHQKKLNDLMEQETKYLREQDKLSQYDLDRANLKYELALKQIALEEAQQNKSKLRLRRDSQGNYTYQYTADDDQVSSVQQEINDLYNQLYNLDAEEYRGNLEKIYDVWAEAQEKMREAAQINDPKVRKEYEELITKEYGERINALTEENENIKSNLYQSTMSQLLELYNTDTANYEQMTEDQKAILDEYITAETELNGAAFDNIFGLYNKNIVNLQSMADSQKDVLMTSLVPQWNSAYQKMTDAIVGEGGFENTLKVAFADIMEQARLAFEELAKYETEYREKSDDNKNYVQDQLTSAERLLKMYQEDLPEIKTLIADLATAWNDVTTAIGNATTAASNYYTTAQEKNADDAADTDQPGDTGGNNEPSGQSEDDRAPDTGGNTDTGSNDKPSLTKGSAVKLKAGTKWYGNSYGGGGSGSTSKQKSVTITLVNENGSHPYHVNKLGWVRKKDIVGYASGGYTGDWAGSDGRLAMLHKKELILNAHDTDNMLDAITILRDITSNLGATLLNKMASINASGVGALGAAGAAAGLEQMVTINAEFPNVTNSHEIEDAINNLVNRASQHISK